MLSPSDIAYLLLSTSYASMLSLMALGLTVTYLTTRVANFAQGSFVSVGAVSTVILSHLLPTPYAAIPLSIAVGSVAGLATYVLALRPLIRREAGTITLMVATLAVSVVFYGLLNMVSDLAQATIGVSVSGTSLRARDPVLARVAGVSIKAAYVALIATMIAVLVASYVLLYRTRLGMSFRAAVENPALARAMGINVEAVQAASWAVSGALGALAGSMWPLLYQVRHAAFGDDILPSIFAASIVGGLSHVYGGVLGGLVIGYAETLIPKAISELTGLGLGEVALYRYAISMAAMILVLLLLPEGLISLWTHKWLVKPKLLRRVGR